MMHVGIFGLSSTWAEVHVLCTPKLAQLGFEPMTFWSWQYISSTEMSVLTISDMYSYDVMRCLNQTNNTEIKNAVSLNHNIYRYVTSNKSKVMNVSDSLDEKTNKYNMAFRSCGQNY